MLLVYSSFAIFVIIPDGSASIDLSRFHAEGDFVLRWREDTGGIRCEGAWRTVGIIEIQNHLAIFRAGLVLINTTRWVGLFVACFIAELDEQLMVFGFGHIQLILIPHILECDITIQTIINHFAKRIGMFHSA